MSPVTNGAGKRKLDSWINGFVKHTENLESPALFRRWAAITALSAVLEQKVWLMTSSHLYANLYVFLIGHPGTGKTRTIRAARAYVKETPEPHVAPISLTWASLVDALVRSKRTLIRIPDGALEYNSMFLSPDEIGAFIHKYDNEMVDGLSAFYDPDEYGHERRGGDLKIKIKSPQLIMLSGATPSRLMELMPDSAWGQGFTSRTIMVFSDERLLVDDFEPTTKAPLNKDLIHDLQLINSIVGEFRVTEDYRNLVRLWREGGEEPAPTHPKLVHYNSRRKVHLYKLSMIAALDKGSTLLLTRDDFNTALNWLVEAETLMPDIFKASIGADGQAQDQLLHFVALLDKGQGVPENVLVREARKLVPAHSVMRTIEIMERSRMIEAFAVEKRTGLRRYRACRGDPPL